MLSFVREGLGGSIVPELNLASNTSDLAARPLNPPATRSAVVAWSAARELTPAVDAFVRTASRLSVAQEPT